MQLTEGVRRMTRAIRHGGRRRMLSAGVAALAVLGALTGTAVAVLSGAPPGKPSSAGTALSGAAALSGASPAAGALTRMPAIRPAAGSVPVAPGLAMGTSSRPIPVARPARRLPAVAPLRRTLQADLLIVAPSSLPRGLATAVNRIPGVTATERIEAVRMRVNGTSTAVLGVDPSVFREFAARPTGASDALWRGVAGGGIAISYTMGKLARIPLGTTVTTTGATTRRLRVVAFGTLGIGGVNAVVSNATARTLGAPAGNAIVVSVHPGDFTAATAAARRLVAKGTRVEQLVSLVSTGPAEPGLAGAGPATETGTPATAVTAMLRAAMSRRGMPYVWGAAGPTSFDCSGLVQWSFAQAGITMPRVAADQALAGPSVPVSQLKPGDLIFYHTDPTAPSYISHVAIYLGNGWMLQAPEPGMDVEAVPADFGTEFAGAIRVNPDQAAAVAARVA